MNGMNRTPSSQQVMTWGSQSQVTPETVNQLVSRISKAMPASPTQFGLASNLILDEVIQNKEVLIQVADNGNHQAFAILDKFMECSRQLIADSAGGVSRDVERHRALFSYVSGRDQNISPTATFLHSKFCAEAVLVLKDEKSMVALLKKTVALGWGQLNDVVSPARYIAHKAAYYLHVIYGNLKNQQSDPQQASLYEKESNYWLLVKNTIKSSSINGTF